MKNTQRREFTDPKLHVCFCVSMQLQMNNTDHASACNFFKLQEWTFKCTLIKVRLKTTIRSNDLWKDEVYAWILLFCCFFVFLCYSYVLMSSQAETWCKASPQISMNKPHEGKVIRATLRAKWTLQETDFTAIQAPWTFKTSTLMLHGFLCNHVVYTTFHTLRRMCQQLWFWEELWHSCKSRTQHRISYMCL